MATGFPQPLWGSAGAPYIVQGAGCVPYSYVYSASYPPSAAAPMGAAPQTFWLINPNDHLWGSQVPMSSYFVGNGVPNATALPPDAAYTLPPGNPSYGHVYYQHSGPAFHMGEPMGPSAMQGLTPAFGSMQQWLGLLGGAGMAQAPAAPAAAAPRLPRERHSDAGGAW